jgi:hypothetical protein
MARDIKVEIGVDNREFNTKSSRGDWRGVGEFAGPSYNLTKTYLNNHSSPNLNDNAYSTFTG